MDSEQAAIAFEGHRAHLTGVAYRMLGTLADAEDAVQEAYLRFARTDASWASRSPETGLPRSTSC